MKHIHLVKHAEPEHLLQKPVELDLDSMIEIMPDTKVSYEGGHFIYARLCPELLSSVRDIILKAPTSGNLRLAGKTSINRLRTHDVTFGYKPSRPVFGHSAGPVRYTVEQPKAFSKLIALGEYLENFACVVLGEEFAKQKDRSLKNIKAYYRMGSTSFTQGVINRSNSLYWHYDRGNYPDSYSAMLWVIEPKVEGGELVLPSLNAFVRPIDGGITLLKGQNLIHGVRKVSKRTPKAERMSVVFYTIAGMEKAESPEIELQKSKLREFKKHFK